MIKLNNLKFADGARKQEKRRGIGTASGIGGTSGRGHKGQNSRSGHTSHKWHEGGQMPLQRRIRKYGFINRYKKVYTLVDVNILNRFPEGTRISISMLKEKKIIEGKKPIKFLNKAELSGVYTVETNAISKGAKESIESKGGSVIILGKEIPSDDNNKKNIDENRE
ncbi:MAG: 50S ribosomal protein L15 [Candidatus Coatesbacteria bacterium]|nr:50S ribosomal protein L15 [Candidatus Coatesbacteria bacterium]